jgi:hypothetical protein
MAFHIAEFADLPIRDGYRPLLTSSGPSNRVFQVLVPLNQAVYPTVLVRRDGSADPVIIAVGNEQNAIIALWINLSAGA